MTSLFKRSQRILPRINTTCASTTVARKIMKIQGTIVKEKLGLSTAPPKEIPKRIRQTVVTNTMRNIPIPVPFTANSSASVTVDSLRSANDHWPVL
jgi:hypothetical protein